jgi:CubicO group peptidase (beta-lactamase class C family)
MGTISRRSTLHLVSWLGAVAGLALLGCSPNTPHPLAPTALPQSLATLPGVAVDVTLTATTDINGHSYTWAVVTPPGHGTLSGTAPALRYTPAAGYVGPDSFTFTADTGEVISAPATISIHMLPTTGPVVPGGEVLDLIMARSLSGQPLGGASLAIAKDGKLVYARGFGYADETGALFEPDSLVRSAGSFAFPAMEVLRLADAGLVSLDAKLIGSAADHGILYDDFTLPAGADVRLRDITLRHLLQWTSGLTDQARAGPLHPPTVAAALGVASPPSCRQVFGYSLRLPLEFAPGTSHGLPWLHNCVFGLVVEKVTGQDVQTAIRASLATMGIHDVRLGGTRRADRVLAAPGEVAYFDSGLAPSIFSSDAGASVPSAYGGYAVSTFSTFLASSVDLVRYMERLQGRDGAPPVLSPSTLIELTTPGVASGTAGEWTQTWGNLEFAVLVNPAGQRTWGDGMVMGGFFSEMASHSDGWSFAWQYNSRAGDKDPLFEILTALGAGFTGSATDLYLAYPSPALPPYTGQ